MSTRWCSFTWKGTVRHLACWRAPTAVVPQPPGGHSGSGASLEDVEPAQHPTVDLSEEARATGLRRCGAAALRRCGAAALRRCQEAALLSHMHMRRDARERGEVEVEALEADGDHARQFRQLDPLEGVAAALALVARVLVGPVEHFGLEEGREGLLERAVERGRRAEGADGEVEVLEGLGPHLVSS